MNPCKPRMLIMQMSEVLPGELTSRYLNQEHHVEDKNIRKTRHAVNLIPRHLKGIGPSRRYGHDAKEHITEHHQRSWTCLAISAGRFVYHFWCAEAVIGTQRDPRTGCSISGCREDASGRRESAVYEREADSVCVVETWRRNARTQERERVTWTLLALLVVECSPEEWHPPTPLEGEAPDLTDCEAPHSWECHVAPCRFILGIAHST
ncbi:hypothetical protein quinque_012702 [Culex quinquefasciatus]